MADKFPLIFNTSANQIQELAENDNLDLTNSSIKNATSIGATTINITGIATFQSDMIIDGVLTVTDVNSTSDENLKENIRAIENPLQKILQINGVEFDWKNTKNASMGVIAQEVEKIFPQLIKESETHKSVNYNGLIGVLIEVVKEQNNQINILNERVRKLED